MLLGVDTKSMCKNNEKSDKFYRKVAFVMYTEMVNFRHQSWKAASNLKPHRGLGTRLPTRDNGHVTHYTKYPKST